MKLGRWVFLGLAAGAAAGLWACAADDAPQRQLTPQDFATTTAPAWPRAGAAPGGVTPGASGGNGSATQPGGVADAGGAVSSAAGGAATGNGDTTSNGGTSGDTSGGGGDPDLRGVAAQLPKATVTVVKPPVAGKAYTLDAMVGQINGQPVYASAIFKPMEVQLTRLGRELPPRYFQAEAIKLIQNAVVEQVFNKTLIGEAERDLSEQQQGGLKEMLKEYREELIRKYGAGSPNLADAALREKNGKSLEEMITERRQAVLIQRYLTLKFGPKINITRREIERYFNLHPEEFNPKPGRILRIIRVVGSPAPGLGGGDAAAVKADQIDAQLAGGKSFAEVAASRLNTNHPGEGGLWPNALVGDKPFGIENVDQAIVALKAGEHSGRLAVGDTFWWVYAEKIEAGQARTLREAQQDIENLLRAQRNRQLEDEYRRRMEAEGGFSSVTDMIVALVEIAINRYSKPPE